MPSRNMHPCLLPRLALPVSHPPPMHVPLCGQVEILDAPVTLQELKAHADGALVDMALFRQSRLSVQPVMPEEWAFITDTIIRRAGDA